MDILILILFFIMFIVIISVILYLIYDYIDYKQDVDKSFVDTTLGFNNNIGITNSNIDITKKVLNNSISSVKDDVNTIKNYNDNIVTRMNIIDTSFNNVSSNLSSYFKFTEDKSNNITNNKIFERTFSTINPNLNLLTNVTAVSGMTIQTNPKINKNLKICDDTSNCMKFDVNNRLDNERYYDKNNKEYVPMTINLSPDNISYLRLNNKDNSALAEFDLVNNIICLGGGIDGKNNTCPLKIEDGKIYLKDLNIDATSNNTSYNVNGNKLNELSSSVKNALNSPLLDVYFKKIMSYDDNINSALINYIMSYNDSTKIKTIDFNIRPNIDINYLDNYLLITLPTYIIGTVNLTTFNFVYNTNTPIQYFNCINTDTAMIKISENDINIILFFNKNIPKDFILDFKMNFNLITPNNINSSKQLITTAYIKPIIKV